MESFLVMKLMELAEESTSSDSSFSDCPSSSGYEFLIEEPEQVKTKNYISNIVSGFSDEDFKSHFRISRSSVEKLMGEIRTDISVTGRPRVPLKEALLATIWMVATQESLRAVGDRFGFGKGHIHRVFVETCKLLTANINKYIVWPKGQEAINNVSLFNNLREDSFRGVFGCVDGVHIPIPDHMTDNSYYNHKGFYSVILQGICNAKMEFINIFVGWPGSSQDGTVWVNSEVYKRLKEDVSTLLPQGTFLLGDTAYPLDKFLMVPFKDDGHLTRKQHLFNEKLSNTRIIIEKAFVRLIGQFKKLKYIHARNLEYVKYIVLSACILHNISIKDGVIYVDDEFIVNDEEPESEFVDCSYFDNCEATLLRNEIMDSIN